MEAMPEQPEQLEQVEMFPFIYVHALREEARDVLGMWYGKQYDEILFNELTKKGVPKNTKTSGHNALRTS